MDAAGLSNWEMAPVDAIFSGSSFFFAHAAATVLAATTDAATEMVTAAGSLSSFCFSAADGETAADADVSFHIWTEAVFSVLFKKIKTASEFSLSLFKHILKSFLRFLVSFFNHALGFLLVVFNPGIRPLSFFWFSSFSLSFPCSFCGRAFQIQFVNGISIYNKLFIFSSHNFPS